MQTTPATLSSHGRMNDVARTGVLRPPEPFRLSPGQMAALAVLWGLVIVYSSLLLGPDGTNFAPLSPAEALKRFLSIQYFDNGSDQRADWIANLLMLAPFAYLVNGALGLSRAKPFTVGLAVAIFALSLVFILAVKFAQLFFPPRTVSINYILAQSLGAILGIAIFQYGHRKLLPAVRAMVGHGEGLVPVLGAYTALVVAYFLAPFDFALSPGDLAGIFSGLSVPLFPGMGHGVVHVALVVAADAVATVPVGMLLAVTGRELSFEAHLVRGLMFALPVAFISLFVLSANPYFFSLVARMAGVAFGIYFMQALRGRDLWKRHYRYGRMVPFVFPLYVLFLAFARGLFQPGWMTADQALRGLDHRYLLPLWDLYIGSKADVGRTIFAGAALFGPIGMMVWFRRGFWSRGALFSAVLAFLLSLAIEVARMLKPGFTPDFSMPLIAAAAAALASRAMLPLWKMFELEAKRGTASDPFQIAVARVEMTQPPPVLSVAVEHSRIGADETVRDQVEAVPTDRMIDAGARLIHAHARDVDANWERAVSLALEVWEAMEKANRPDEE